MTVSEREVLPVNVRPVHYDLCVHPDLDKHVFGGRVRVELDVLEPTTTIVANTHELTFKSASIDGGETASDISIDEDLQRVTFTFGSELQKGKVALIVEFDGILNDKMAGFYASTYEDEGKKKTMAVTQFEAVDARRAFPCWDEPALKATFTVSLIVDRDLAAVSNMPEVSCEDHGDSGQVKRTYEKTPIMSTYLLAFVIGEFDMIEKSTSDGVAIRVYTPKGKSVQGEFGLDVAVKSLEFYNKYFEIPYPLPKLDLLAIPDFSAGAMENWGCVTYRSTALLVDPENSSTATKQWVALVVAHELAHQWFGNLVTMVWWTDLWLNEGFATWVEYLAVNHLFPDWKIWTQFVYQDFGRALQLDALANSHPIEVEVFKASDVDEIFDHVSYCKGSSVIRMLVNFLGEEAFRVGIVKYLKKYEYGNASTDQLWESLAESSGKPVETVMQCWTRQQGFPVLDVSEGDSASQLKVRQQRFLVDGIPADAKDCWSVPIMHTSSSGDCKEAFMLKDAEGTIDIPENADWVKLNAGQSGIYRVRYSKAILDRLKNAIESQCLTDPADRLGVQNDAIALARAGLLPTVDVLQLMLSYAKETNYTVWADLLGNNFNEIKNLLMHTDMHDKFKLFGQDVLGAIVEKLGWDQSAEDDHLTSLLRSLVISKMGVLGHEQTSAEACKRFDAFVASGFKEGLLPDLRGGVYAMALVARKDAAYETLMSLYRTAELHEEKVRVLSSLGAIPDQVMLQKTLDFSFTEEVRSQDVMYAMGSVASNPMGSELAWTFLKRNWAKIVEKFGSGFTIGRLVTYATTCFSTLEKAKEVREFFEENRAPGGERAVKQSIEKIESAAAWLARDGDSIREFLNSKY